MDGETKGRKWFVDIDTVKKKDEHTYFWILVDYPKPSPLGDMSALVYFKSDCSLYRNKTLVYYFYKKPMGKGNSREEREKNPEWGYPPPKSNVDNVLGYVCKI